MGVGFGHFERVSQISNSEATQVEVQDYTAKGISDRIDEVMGALEVVLGVVAQLRKRVERLEAERQTK